MLLNHRRIFILPSRRGFDFIFLITLLLTIAFVYNNNLAYLLAFLLASVFFVTILHSYQSLAGLVLQKGHCKSVFAGEAAGFEIHINNPSDSSRHQLKITLEQTEILTLPPQTKTNVVLYSLAKQRGWHRAGKITVSSTYPLGLFRAWSPIRFDLSVLVYPKPAVMAAPLPEQATADGQHNLSNTGMDDFYGLKEYQRGDPVRHIHWKSVAKGLGVFSKQYSGGNLGEIWLDYRDTNGLAAEDRISMLCRWVLDADQAGLRYGFILPGLKLSPDNGVAHTKKCLEALALF